MRVGRYGPYLERGEQRASLPADLAPDELTPEKVEELLSPARQPLARHGPGDAATRSSSASGRYGPYVTEVLPEGADEKPRTASLFASMSPETVTLDDALRLLSLPRVVGELDGEEVTAQNGRYGPYVKKGSESRSLESEEQLFTVTLEEAQALLAQPPRRRGRGAATRAAQGARHRSGQRPPDRRPRRALRPVRHGRRDEREPAARATRGGVTLERAIELLAERRAKSA